MQKIFAFFFVSSLVALLALGIMGTRQEADAGKSLGNGMKCTFNSDCSSNNCSFKTCKARSGGKKELSNGASCTFNSDCSSGNCSFKTCKARGGSGGKQLGNGASCTFNSDCTSKNCSFKKCKSR